MPAERVTIPSGALSLEGVLQRPAEGEPAGIVIVCHPHPLYGGSMDNNVVDALCDAALQEGLGALRFNFRGVGQSTGEHGGGEPEQEDVLAALAFARALLPRAALGLAGYSFGAATAARAVGSAEPAPSAVLLVSPPVSNLAARPPAVPSQPWLILTGDRDHVCPSEELEALVRKILPAAQTVVFEGADHSWWGHEAELRDTAGNFLRWQLASS
jgi:uncharacterized protein